MRKFLISTTALSVAIAPLGTMPGIAQTLLEDGSVIGPDGSVLCVPTADAACDLDAILGALQEGEAAAQAEAEAAAQAEAEAAAQAEAEAAAQAEAEAAAQAEAEAAAQAEAEAAAQAEAEAAAQAAAEAEAAAQAEAEKAAQAEADAAAQAEADAAAAQAAADAAAQADADAAAQAEAAQAEADALQAEADAAAQADADAAQADADAAALAEAEAAAQAEADAAAQAAAEEAAAIAAAEAAAQAEADAAALAAAEAESAATAAAEAAAAAQLEAENASEADAEAAAQAAADAEAAALAAALAAEEAAAQAAAEAVALQEAEAAVEAGAANEADAAAEVETDPATEAEAEVIVDVPEATAPDADTADATVDSEGVFDTRTGETIDPEVAAAAVAAAEEELEITDTGEFVDPVAGLRVADPDSAEVAEPVDAPVVSETEVESLTELLTLDPTDSEIATIAAADTVAEPRADDEGPVEFAPTESEDLVAAVTETITEADVRSSDKEFAAAPEMRDDGKKSGLSDLEKAGLIVLGALVVGSIIKSNRERREEETRVVSNTGDRVIVLRPDGTYQVLKDDDTIIRRPGSTVRTETFRDGSTRTIIEREDGTQVVTIRDASGRVLRRATYDDRGREIVLIDDLREEEVVIVRELPKPKTRIVISSKDEDTALKRELASIEAEKAGRKFSLRQIREIPEVRALAAVIDTENVTFASGSSAIAAAEARDLADLGRVMQELLEVNPGEVFLIEGHTDATGKSALNLALSDRRAESVALALTEYFDIPPENMIVQGYGESELLIDTQASEPANRRVEVRVITPLLQTTSDE